MEALLVGTFNREKALAQKELCFGIVKFRKVSMTRLSVPQPAARGRWAAAGWPPRPASATG